LATHLADYLKVYISSLSYLMFTVSFLAITNVAIAAQASSFYSNFESITLTDQEGHTFPVTHLEGKITLFNFIYTHCASTCLLQTKDLVKVRESLPPKLKQNIQFVSVSLDAYDSPKNLKTFSKKMGANQSNWSFVSAKYEDIKLLASRLILFARPKVNPIALKEMPVIKSEVDVLPPLETHATDIWLVDSTGLLIQKYAGNPLDIVRLEKELNQLYTMQVTN
jgi:cytochrome oxidase Cu insertion factor (SCO1/SenC/PrrC family)